MCFIFVKLNCLSSEGDYDNGDIIGIHSKSSYVQVNDIFFILEAKSLNINKREVNSVQDSPSIFVDKYLEEFLLSV